MQLVQPVLTVLWSAALLGEEVTLYTFLAALLVFSSVALTRWTRVRRATNPK